nr:unnamed protein product [Callosobruchus analis]
MSRNFIVEKYDKYFCIQFRIMFFRNWHFSAALQVYTRNEKGVRGYCLAYLLAFDKHWNLMLENVEEHWTRKKRKKGSSFRPPPIKITEHEADKTLENCSREVFQLMMRGEHVVLVTVAENK